MVKLSKSGSVLAFVVNPEALQRLGEPKQLWPALFFFMVIILGIDSQVL